MMNKYLARCYRREIKKTRILTAEEERVVCERIKNGDKKATDLLIESSLRSVWNVAIKYSTVDTDMFDLIQEGNLGLLHAVEMFDPTAGVRFNTYAMFWIRQKIQRFHHEKVRPIRVPIHKEITILKIKNFCENFCKENGREPKVAEISESIGKPEKFVLDILMDTESCLSLDYLRLDRDNEEEAKSTLDVRDLRFNPEINFCRDCEKTMLEQAMDILSERDRYVIKLRYGFFGKEHTLMETAEKFGISYERCRQIQKDALDKLNEFYRKRRKNI